MTTFVGVAQRGWSGQIFDLSHLSSFFSFLLITVSTVHARTFTISVQAISLLFLALLFANFSNKSLGL